jgi:hypothetical protein
MKCIGNVAEKNGRWIRLVVLYMMHLWDCATKKLIISGS